MRIIPCKHEYLPFKIIESTKTDKNGNTIKHRITKLSRRCYKCGKLL